jgi:hypothetical protein
MKYVKMLGLAAVAAMGLMAFLGASSASATVLCKTTTNPCGASWIYSGPALSASLDPNTTATLENTSGSIEDTCSGSTVEGAITNAGDATHTVVGSVEHLTFTGCTQETTVTVETGTLELHSITGTNNGTVTAIGFKVDIKLFGVQCGYGAGGGTDLGTFTEGNPGTMDIHAVVNKEAGSFLCPGDLVWNGTYTITTPNSTLDAEPS